MTARRAVIVGGVLLAVSLGALIATGLAAPGGAWSALDLRVYFWGGQIARHSGDLYGLRYLDTGLRFTYPPVAALIFAALASLPFAAVRWALTGLTILAVAAVTWLSWGTLGYPRSRGRLGGTLAVTAIAVWSEPVWQTLTYGQVNAVLMLIIMADLCLPDDRRWKGAGVGLAAGLKLTPLIFIAYLLLTRRSRAGLVALAAFLATIAIPAVFLPSQSLQYWAGGLFADPRRVGNLAYVGNQSLNGLLLRLTGGGGAARAAWVAAALIIGAGGLLLAVAAARRGQELAGIVICALTGLEISPVSWSHHWIWVTPALVLAVGGALRARSGVAWRSRWRGLVPRAGVLMLLGVFWSRMIWLIPEPDVQGKAAPGLWLLPGDLYPLAGLAALALAAVWTARGRREEPAGYSPPNFLISSNSASVS